jgi:hypothetical protein
VLVDAVVVAGDDSGADVDVGSDDGVAEVVQVICLGALAERGFLGFDEVAYVGAFADAAFGAKMGVGTEDGVVGDLGGVENASVAYGDVVAELRILDDGVGADAGVTANGGFAEELDEGLDDGVGPDVDFGVDDAGLGSEDRDASGHQTLCRREAHGRIEVHHLGDGVGAEDFVDGVSFDGDDAFAFGDEHGGDVGEVELAVGIVGVEGVELVKESAGFEAVNAGVDLGGVELLGTKGFLFDDGDDVGIVGREAEDAAVAGGISRYGSEDGHGCLLGEMGVADGGDSFGADERDVAGENEEILGERGFVESEERLEHLHGVAGAALFGLRDELDTGVFDGGFYAVGFVADDTEDVVGGNDLPGGSDDVEKEGAASYLVEDFGALAIEPRAFACGHDGDGEAGGVHTGIWSHEEMGAGDVLMRPSEQTSLTTAMPVRTVDCRFGGWSRERWQTGHREQEFVRGIEEVQVGVDRTVGGG